jgi:sugar/nucleoside kinase (ribokinase family)
LGSAKRGAVILNRMFVAAGPRAASFCEWVRRLGEHCEVLGDRPAPDHSLLHLDARELIESGEGSRLRKAIERSRRHRALISLDLGSVEWIRERGGSRTAYQLATIAPDLVFANEESAELAAPLEGIATVAVVAGSDACLVHGRHVAGPAGSELDPAALAATFCVALVEGAAPVEAAGRAVLVAATAWQGVKQ